MERFRPDGHLTDEALAALIQEQPIEELGRLEMAEHLAFCDLCLQRYTDAMTAGPLLAPAHSCRETLWLRIRSRTLRIVTSRYATAAAAIALALTMLWGGTHLSVAGPPGQDFFQQAGSAVSQRVQSFPSRWNDSVGGVFSNISEFFEGIGGNRPQATQGGTYS